MSTATPHERPTGGLELWSWFYMRLSGLALVFLALGHFAIMHLVHPIEELSYDFVAHRYQFLGWRLFDGAMLLLALLHGLNGIRILIDDHVRSERWHTRAYWILRIVGFVFVSLGLIVIIFFKPEVTVP